MKLKEGDIIRGIAVSPKLQRVRFSELLDDFLTDYRINSKKSLSIVEMRLKKHVSPFFRDRRASEITSATVSKYIQKRQEDKAANATINRELAIIRRTFILACKHGKLLNRPMFSLLSENNVRKGFFEPQQLEAVLTHLPEYLKPLVRFLYITGWRKGEALNLKWKDVNFNTELISLEVGTTKNKEGRVFPFTSELPLFMINER